MVWITRHRESQCREAQKSVIQFLQMCHRTRLQPPPPRPLLAEGVEGKIMKTKFMRRSGAAVGVLIAAMSAAPAALADTTTDVGPATVTLGGFSAFETVYRSRNEAADIGSSYSGIPFPSTSTAHTSELRFTARQSRLSVLAQGNADSDTHLAFYGEFDFMAGPDRPTPTRATPTAHASGICTAPWTGTPKESRSWPARTGRCSPQQPRHHAAQRSGARHDRGAICRGLQLGPAGATPHRQELGPSDLAGGVA